MNWIIYALLSAFFASLTAILAKIGIKGVDSSLATAIRTVVILIFAWSIVFATHKAKNINNLSRHTWLFLILSGLATGISWLFYFKALQLGPASRVAPIDKLSIVMTIVLSFVILHEKFSWAIAGGASLMVSGALIIALAR